MTLMRGYDKRGNLATSERYFIDAGEGPATSDCLAAFSLSCVCKPTRWAEDARGGNVRGFLTAEASLGSEELRFTDARNLKTI